MESFENGLELMKDEQKIEPNPRGPCAEPESKPHGRLAVRQTQLTEEEQAVCRGVQMHFGAGGEGGEDAPGEQLPLKGGG